MEQTNTMHKIMALFICAAMILGILPISVLAAGDTLLIAPISVELTDANGNTFAQGQSVKIGDVFKVTYNYGDIAAGEIDASVEYALPTLSNQLQMTEIADGETVKTMTVYDRAGAILGTLRCTIATGAMTFQFDERFDGNGVTNFYLTFDLSLDAEDVTAGDNITLTFPVAGGNTSFDINVADVEKDKPVLVKSVVAATDENGMETGVLNWTVQVTNGENPYTAISIHDTWSHNQDYVTDSFCVNGTAVSDGLTVSDTGFQYEFTGITESQVDTITYQTTIKSSAFQNASGVPLTSGNIRCDNTAQAFYPGDSEVTLSDKATASHTHPIAWLYKTSGNVIDRITGEMEWTVTIYNNGLAMRNAILYDRLSPGVSVKNDTATIQIGNGTIQTVTDFNRDYETDQILGADANYVYNLSYDLGAIGSTTIIKYRTIITDPDTYNAAENQPPNSIYDNKAFVTYDLDNGGTTISNIKTPVVEKSGGYDASLIGKTGELEVAYHTIKWTMTVNQNGESLTGASVADKLTYGAPVTAVPTKQTYCNHIYDDTAVRNRPQYSFDGKNFIDFTAYDAASPNTPFTYKLSTDADGMVYDMTFYLGDITQKVIIVYRSTATDEIIYANNVTGTNCQYQNKATLTTDNAFSYASADVTYTSTVVKKNETRSWYNRPQDSYDFQNNRFPWSVIVNQNQMLMKDVCITDTLSEGTSLVEGSVLLGPWANSGTYSWYKLTALAGTISVPKYTTGAEKPYYTYDKTTREIKIYLADVPESAVGTIAASKQILFYVQVDVDHPIFTDSTYPGYLGAGYKNTGTPWYIPNTAKLENDLLFGDDAVTSTTTCHVYNQLLSKTGTPHKNVGSYSIDYSLAINRIQQTLPDNAVIVDALPNGLRLDASTLKLYEATVKSAAPNYVLDDGTAGILVKGDEVDAAAYSVETAENADGTINMRVTLPQNSGAKMYVLDYSCDVTDVSKAPFVNKVNIEGVDYSNTSQTVTRVQLNAASGGGTLVGAEKTRATVTKTDAATGLAVAGAQFGLYYKGVLIETKTTDEAGQIVFENLNKNFTYTVMELAAAPGYLDPVNATETFKATAAENPVQLAFTNTPKTGSVQFLKTDTAGAALSGAEFGIWSTLADVGMAAPLATAASQDNGIVTFTGLTAGQTYYIAEQSAPEGFVKSDEVIAAKMNTDGTMEKLWLQSDANETAITSFANIPIVPPATGNLIVSKTVSGNAASTTKDFTFTVTLGDSAINGAYGDMTFANGIATFTLKANESKTAMGLPSGATYSVVESDNAGYTVTKSNEKGTITTGATVTVTFNNHKSDEVPPVPKTGSLTVSKTVSGNAASTTKAFTFTVTLGDSAINGTYGDMTFVNGIASFTLKANESKTATGLPAGTTYTVVERDNDGYTVTKTNEAGTIATDTTIIAMFNNHKGELIPPIPQTGTLTVSKTVSGNAASTTKDFTFTVTLGDSAINGTYGDMTFANGIATFTLKANESKTATGLPSDVTYTAVESDNAGYTVTKTNDTGIIMTGTTIMAAFNNHKDKVISSVPQTGDNSNVLLYMLLMTVSGMGLSVLTIFGRKKRKAKR